MNFHRAVLNCCTILLSLSSAVVHAETLTAESKAAAVLTPPSEKYSPKFGSAVAITSEQVLVSSLGNAGETGSVYVYTGSDGNWSVKQVITDTSGSESFGAAVALTSAGIIVVDPPKKKLYLYTGSPGNYVPSDQLELSFPGANSVAMKNDLVVVMSTDGSVAAISVENGKLTPANNDRIAAIEEPGDARISTQDGLLLVGVPAESGKAGKALLFEIQASEQFLSEESVNEVLGSACGKDFVTNPAASKCVESTLHNLWEERKILFTDYDRILKGSWKAAASGAEGPKPETHPLFDKFLEEQRLERRMELVYTNLISKHAENQFARVDAALNGKPLPKSTFDPASMKEELKRLHKLLSDLIKNNPDLPPSTAMQLDVDELDQTFPSATKQNFIRVEGAL